MHIATTLAPDLLTVATYLVPLDAHIIQGCLKAAGVPAVLADANLGQTGEFLTSVLGGVRILVPAQYMEQAQAVIASFNRGDYQLDDDVDVGDA